MSNAPPERVESDLTVQTISQLGGKKQKELKTLWIHSVATDTHAIGWLPVSAYETRAASDDLTAIYRNDDCVGWSMTAKSNHRGVMKLYQIWVRPDARILTHGKALVASIREKARHQHCYIIEAWVAEDLPANLFWEAIGFTRQNWRLGRGEKPRKLYLWTTTTLQFGEEFNVNRTHRHTHDQGIAHGMAEA
jgi:GNAT superfamily N-acetyltransferase